MSSTQQLGVTASATITSASIIALIGLAWAIRRSAGAQALQPPPPTPRYRVGLLEVALPPLAGPGNGRLERVLRNEACIAAALKEVGVQLFVTVRGTEAAPAGLLRDFVAELYRQLWDAACLQGKVLLDVRVLPGAAAGAGLASAKDAVLAPPLQIVMSDGLFDVEDANERRAAARLPPLLFASLQDCSARAYNPAYFYLEDAFGDVPRFRSVACGGTFDNLHFGHKKLLTMAASVCDGVLTVGVTADAMLRHKGARHLIEDVARRMERVAEFLQCVAPALRVRVEELSEPAGPPAREPAFDAIVVSSETVAGAEAINELRRGKGFSPLAVVVTHRTEASSLSSTFIRRQIELRNAGRKNEA